MCKQALTTNGSVSCSLSMEIFDKQILPVLMYDSVTWGIPGSNNCLHLDHIPLHIKILDPILQRLCQKCLPKGRAGHPCQKGEGSLPGTSKRQP